MTYTRARAPLIDVNDRMDGPARKGAVLRNLGHIDREVSDRRAPFHHISERGESATACGKVLFYEHADHRRACRHGRENVDGTDLTDLPERHS
jgi:hypothetical protein